MLTKLITQSTQHMETAERASGIQQMLDDLQALAKNDGCVAAAWAIEALSQLQFDNSVLKLAAANLVAHAVPLEGGGMKVPAILVEHAKSQLKSFTAYSAPAMWIPCELRLPELEVPVWLLEPRLNPFIGCRTQVEFDEWLWAHCYESYEPEGESWICDTCEVDDYKPTHWMPLPPVPILSS